MKSHRHKKSAHKKPPPPYEPGMERIEAVHASDASRPICFRRNIELDLHHALKEVRFDPPPLVLLFL